MGRACLLHDLHLEESCLGNSMSEPSKTLKAFHFGVPKLHPTDPRKPRNPKGKIAAAVIWLPGPHVSAYACRPTKLIVWSQAYLCSITSKRQHRKRRAAAAWHPVTRLTRQRVDKCDSIKRSAKHKQEFIASCCDAAVHHF